MLTGHCDKTRCWGEIIVPWVTCICNHRTLYCAMDLRSESMKSGYNSEIDARVVELQNAQSVLETNYMSEQSESQIEENMELKGRFEDALNAAEALMPALAATNRTVKMAIESC